jgi:hypothetical protein
MISRADTNAGVSSPFGFGSAAPSAGFEPSHGSGERSLFGASALETDMASAPCCSLPVRFPCLITTGSTPEAREMG